MCPAGLNATLACPLFCQYHVSEDREQGPDVLYFRFRSVLYGYLVVVVVFSVAPTGPLIAKINGTMKRHPFGGRAAAHASKIY